MRTIARHIGKYASTIEGQASSVISGTRTYTISTLVLMFFSFVIGGWVWELILHIFSEGRLINRGILTGPWLPIYGVGCILMIVALKRFHRSPVALLFMIMTLSAAVEYGTSLMLEYIFHMRWWDYTSMRFQLHGRICALGIITFGVGGLLIVYVVAPALDQLFSKLSHRTRMIICVTLTCLFMADMVYSFFNPNMGADITYVSYL